MTKKILIVEDEKPIADIIKYNFQKEGFQVVVAYNGQDGVEMFYQEYPDLIILDLMLPDKDGFTACKEIREESKVPIVVLTAKKSEVDKVLGLELGADDYVTKPFSNRELIARVKAIFRRIDLMEADLKSVSQSPQDDEDMIKYNDIVINLKTAEVLKNGQPVELTHREYKLLVYLVRYQGEVISRDRLLTEVWGFDYVGEDRTVDVTIRRLRTKLEEDSKNPQYILTKRGMGYYLRRITHV